MKFSTAKERREFGKLIEMEAHMLHHPAKHFGTELTVADIERIFQMKYDAAYRLVRETLEPMGAAKKIRGRYYISPWGVRRLINQTGRCGHCGREWTIEQDLEYLRKHGMQADPVAYEEVLKDPNLERPYLEFPPPPKVTVHKDGPWSKRAQREYEQELKKLSRKKPPTPPVNPDRFKKK